MYSILGDSPSMHTLFHIVWLAKRVYNSSFNFSVGINGNGYNTLEQMKQSVGQKVAVIVAQQPVAIGLRKHQIGYGGLQSPFKSRGFWSSRTSQTEEFSTERPLGQKGKSRGGIERGWKGSQIGIVLYLSGISGSVRQSKSSSYLFSDSGDEKNIYQGHFTSCNKIVNRSRY